MNVFYFKQDRGYATVKKVDQKGQLKEVDELDVDGDLVRAVYDYTQYSDTVKSGDLMFIEQSPSNVVVAVLSQAWPVQLSGRRHKELHLFKFDKRYED